MIVNQAKQRAKKIIRMKLKRLKRRTISLKTNLNLRKKRMHPLVVATKPNPKELLVQKTRTTQILRIDNVLGPIQEKITVHQSLTIISPRNSQIIIN